MYELDDHLLIRDDKVIAVSANERFTDGDNPIHPQKGDTIAFVTSALGAVAYEAELVFRTQSEQRMRDEMLLDTTAQVVASCPTCGTIIED
jgi:hypothetical protein